ncbi:glycosyltransferase [Porticoccaceae bacterium]|nr:glycosyltransferase [Porticoccaceae bacterium]
MREIGLSNTILHISHTDIARDSRILKEMKAISSFASKSNMNVVGLGIMAEGSNAETVSLNDCEIISVRLKMRKLIKLFRPVRPILIFLELVFRFIWQARKYKPSVVHCHDTLVLPIGLLISIWSGAKLIYDAHELESNRNGQGRIGSRITKSIEIIAWPFVDLFISVSPSINSWYIEHFGEKENILILNAPELRPESENNRNSLGIRQKFGITNDETIFVYLGILAKGRGIEKALKVFSRPEIDAHLIFVGWGLHEELITQYGSKANNIHLHHPVAHHDVVPLVADCDFGLCMIEPISLSDYLCLPNKLFEYCFSGLPVLASDFPELSRVVKTHDLGIVCGDSEQDLASAVLELTSTTKKFEFNCLEELSWQSQGDLLVKSYQNLLKLTK